MTTEPREHAIVTPVHGTLSGARRRIARPRSASATRRWRWGSTATESRPTSNWRASRQFPNSPTGRWSASRGCIGSTAMGSAVVASWMTSQDREDAIEDNLRYVRSVVTEAIHQTGEPQALVYVGYSQGVAMAWRAAILGARRIDGLAVFGGDVPPELGVRPTDAMPAGADRPRPRRHAVHGRAVPHRSRHAGDAATSPSNRTRWSAGTAGPPRSGARSAASSPG